MLCWGASACSKHTSALPLIGDPALSEPQLSCASRGPGCSSCSSSLRLHGHQPWLCLCAWAQPPRCLARWPPLHNLRTGRRVILLIRLRSRICDITCSDARTLRRAPYLCLCVAPAGGIALALWARIAGCRPLPSCRTLETHVQICIRLKGPAKGLVGLHWPQNCE